jgi:hypothetical protein
VYLMGVCLMGVHLTGVHLMSVHLTGQIEAVSVSYWKSRNREIENALIGEWAITLFRATASGRECLIVCLWDRATYLNGTLHTSTMIGVGSTPPQHITR